MIKLGPTIVAAVLGAAIMGAGPVAAQAGGRWTIGEEREVDAGTYMRLTANQQGWRIWRVETRSGAHCLAVKSARGRPHPAPLGVGSAFWGGTPSIRISGLDRSRLTYSWQAHHLGRVRVKTRPIGARFWDDVSSYGETSPFSSEAPVEVHLTSWEYPELLIGLSEETAVFDPVGISWAEEQLRACT